MIKNDKTDHLLPNLDCLLRGLLGAAVGLQGLDDGELPGVARPVPQDSLPTDADPGPCLGHLVCATALEEVQTWNDVCSYSDLFSAKDLLSAWNVFSCP